MKSMKRLFLLVCALLLLSSCNFEPYSGERPTDYGKALWSCEAYRIWFFVDPEKEDGADPEGELQVEDTVYFCKFYFIHQTNQLYISIYPIEYKNIPDTARDRSRMLGEIEGECSFSDTSFVYRIENVQGDVFDKAVKEMIFQRALAA